MTSGLLAEILDAHGGAAQWQRYAGVDATIVSGGGFFALRLDGALTVQQEITRRYVGG